MTRLDAHSPLLPDPEIVLQAITDSNAPRRSRDSCTNVYAVFERLFGCLDQSSGNAMWLCRYEEVWQPWDVLCHTDCLELVVHLLKISHQLLIFSPRLAASFPQQDCSFPGALTAVCNPVAKITVMFSLCLWMRWLVCSMNRRGQEFWAPQWGRCDCQLSHQEVWHSVCQLVSSGRFYWMLGSNHCIQK